MVSLKRCREILGPSCSASDAQLEGLRDQLVAIANMALETGRKKVMDGAASAFLDRISPLTLEEREEVVERAAIMQFDGGLTCPEAQELALDKWVNAQRRVKREHIN